MEKDKSRTRGNRNQAEKMGMVASHHDEICVERRSPRSQAKSQREKKARQTKINLEKVLCSRNHAPNIHLATEYRSSDTRQTTLEASDGWPMLPPERKGWSQEPSSSDKNGYSKRLRSYVNSPMPLSAHKKMRITMDRMDRWSPNFGTGRISLKVF